MSLFTPTHWDVDDDLVMNHLINDDRSHGGHAGVMPRPERLSYGSDAAIELGLRPMEGIGVDDLVQPDDFEEVIEECHAKKRFPMYHMEDSGFFDNWTQDGLNYCWTWAMTATLMANRLMEGLPPVALAPTSLGWTVNWRNSGGYLTETIAAAKSHGIAPLSAVDHIHSRNPNKFDDDWEEQALENRVLEWWDGPVSKDIRQVQYMLTMLANGKPLYVAYNWWSHALTNVGLNYNPRARHKVDVLAFNSHGDGLITMEGSRGLPDEYYGIRSTSLPRNKG